MSEKLRDFVQNKWTPPKVDDVYYSSTGKTIALNFIDFLSDSRGKDVSGMCMTHV